MEPGGMDSTRTLIDDYLAQQKRLQTPVARFSEAQSPALEPLYRDLIPLSAPAPGEQYAFEVDLDSCTGCKACVAGCHSLNGLDDEEAWRDVGLLVGGTQRHPFQQTVTTACHHCADPACLNGCPVLAYEKDPATGIVRHLDDQCIGCQYCVLKCPYDVPKYNERLGIVRKCDMCHTRLSAGEAPACVQACPTQAIRIVTVSTQRSEVTSTDANDEFLPETVAFETRYTQPTTRYVSNKPLPAEIRPADSASIKPQPPHWPLVFMLTLMPLAIGCVTLEAAFPLHTPPLARVAWGAGLAGLICSVFHLGQPLRAWRIFLGIGRSWLSREAVVFGIWFGVLTAQVVLDLPLQVATAVLGLTGLWCSAMIYADTRRHFWRLSQTGPRFFGTAAVLGCASAFALNPSMILALGTATSVLLKLGWEVRELKVLDEEDETLNPARKTALLLTGPLRAAFGARVTLALVGAFLAPAVILAGAPAFLLGAVPLLLTAAELTERYLFFTAVVAPKMPGSVAS